MHVACHACGRTFFMTGYPLNNSHHIMTCFISSSACNIKGFYAMHTDLVDNRYGLEQKSKNTDMVVFYYLLTIMKGS